FDRGGGTVSAINGASLKLVESAVIEGPGIRASNAGSVLTVEDSIVAGQVSAIGGVAANGGGQLSVSGSAVIGTHGRG
ncbi:hypothetical protein Q8G40_30735, partial [Klebsiella pneumoniae]|uniref:hypothetical protein n=1 Tax=Klebsiella pneumoniae TaxID=573 RepID=UPI0030140A08